MPAKAIGRELCPRCGCSWISSTVYEMFRCMNCGTTWPLTRKVA
jgi:tRNA(Ile2) C34 agmatinyltransferase TiaS